MEIKCFLCEESYNSPLGLFKHIKQYVIPPNVAYKCTFKDCYQQFYQKFCFKRHVLSHFQTKANDTSSSTQKGMDCSFSCTESHESPNNTGNENFEKIKIFNYEKELSKVYESATNFIIKLHTYSNFSKSDVNGIKNHLEDLILIPVLNFLGQTQNPDNPIDKTISDVLHDVKFLFRGISSNFKLEKTLTQKELISDVKLFPVDDNFKSSGVIMPLEFQLKKLFERDNYLDDILTHINNTENNPMYVNFVQGKLWKQKKTLYENKILIPYFLYADDFGINNPLGSKANRNSICNFYYSFPCKPTKKSKLEDVFLACSINSSDIKQYGNKCYEPLVEVLKKIEVEGIKIRSKNGIRNVHFIMGLFLGDNLGLNIALGFSKSFSATHYCRFCLITKSTAQTQTSENTRILRNRINYRESMQKGTMKENGINTVCAFNDIPSFHCTENYTVDVMHDLFEGVCHYILTEALVYFIKTMKYLSIETLNNRLKHFSYDDHDKGSEKLNITNNELENRKLKTSAKQMMALCQYFSVILGEFIPNQDSVWIFLIKFFELIDDILCYEVSEALVKQIKIKVENLNNEYQIIFKQKLKPKFHFLLHYPTIIKQSGPLRQLWSFKFEAKHKEFKIYSHVITSRKNIAKSFSFKQQMSFINYLLQLNNQEDFICAKEFYDFEVKKKISIKLKIPMETFTLYSEATIWGYRYNDKQVVYKFTNDFELYKIYLIVKTKCNKLIVCCKKLSTTFNIHYSAFECGTSYPTYTFINILDLVGPPIGPVQTSQGKPLLKLKEYYKNIY